MKVYRAWASPTGVYDANMGGLVLGLGLGFRVIV